MHYDNVGYNHVMDISSDLLTLKCIEIALSPYILDLALWGFNWEKLFWGDDPELVIK